MSESIKLGSIVTDAVTRFTGVAVHRLEKMNGNIQIAVQPQCGPSNALEEAVFIDEHHLKVVGSGVSNKCCEPVKSDIRLGEWVRDRITGFEGYATGKTTYLNGCVSFIIEQGVDQDGKQRETTWFDSYRLETVHGGLAGLLSPAKVDEKTKKVPGGASMPIPKNVRC